MSKCMIEKLFAVSEWSTGYEVEHLPTGKTHWMSDGADRYFASWLETDWLEADEIGAPMPPEIGSEEFREEWENDLNSDPQGTLEAYFPEEAV